MDGYVKTHTAWKWTFAYHTGIRCNEINLDGSDKAPSIVRNTYAHAQKMRAAMTYTFGRLHGLRTLPWHQSEITSTMVGNPSVSDTVSSYMVSLQQRKVRAGETQTSARAITLVVLLACVVDSDTVNNYHSYRTFWRRYMISITSLSIGTSSQLDSITKIRTSVAIPGVVAELAGCSKQPMHSHSYACCALTRF